MSSSGQYIGLAKKDGSNLNISVSSDYGSNFTTQSLNIGGSSTDHCEISLSETGQYMLVMASGHNLYLSSNYGSSFSEISNTSQSWRHVEISRKSPSSMYAQLNNSTNTIFESLDFGQNWVAIINHPSGVHYNNLVSNSENMFAFNANSRKIDKYTLGSFVTINKNLNIFNLNSYDSSLTLPDVKFSDTTTFNLPNGNNYELFSNTTFEGTINFDNIILSRATEANSICDITLKDDNKSLTNVTFNNCGSLILENVSTNSTISNFTNNSSPTTGLQITSGSVDINTINIKDPINEFVKLVSHSGTINDLKLDTTTTYNKTFVDISSGVTTTFTNTDSNDNGIYIKGTLDHNGSVGLIVDDDTSKTIPDLVIDSGDTLILSTDIKLPSNLVVNGTITSDGKTFTTTGTGNVSVNSESSIQSTTFDSCGLIKLTSLDTNSVMETLTLNNCTGMQVLEVVLI